MGKRRRSSRRRGAAVQGPKPQARVAAPAPAPAPAPVPAPAPEGDAAPASASERTAAQLMAAGHFQSAIEAFQAQLRQRPDDVEALYGLAECCLAMGAPTSALPVFKRLCELQPKDPDPLYRLGKCLLQLRETEDASTLFQHALSVDPTHGPSITALFDQALECNRFVYARERLDRLRAAHPDNPTTTYLQARLSAREGKTERAIATLQSMATETLPPALFRNQQYLSGKLLDKLDRHREAFAACAAANRSCLEEFPRLATEREAYLQKVASIAPTLDQSLTRGWADALPPDPHQIVWQVGFPRSGTTLLDQVLDAHPRVTVLSETDLSARLLTLLDALPGAYPACLRDLSDRQAQELRSAYLAGLAEKVGPLNREQVYVDKVPLNTLHLAAAARILPQVKIVFSVRHPADVVLSCFMQDFRLSRPLSCFLTMEHTVTLYDAAMDAAAHYDRILHLAKKTIRYEDLVEDLEGQARGLLEFLGLPWDPAVLAYREHAAQRYIATPSAGEVVQPLYSRAMNRWQHYRSELAPWLPGLLRHAARLGYPADDGAGAPPLAERRSA